MKTKLRETTPKYVFFQQNLVTGYKKQTNSYIKHTKYTNMKQKTAPKITQKWI